MRKLTATLGLTLAVLMGSAGVTAASDLPPCTGAYWSNCTGTETYGNGSKYVGEFKDAKRHGQGTYTWPSGNKYVGEHKDNKRHGQGTFTWPSGDQDVGMFINDRYIPDRQHRKHCIADDEIKEPIRAGEERLWQDFYEAGCETAKRAVPRNINWYILSSDVRAGWVTSVLDEHETAHEQFLNDLGSIVTQLSTDRRETFLSYVTERAEEGGKASLYALGQMAETGIGQLQDYNEAFRLYLLSAQQGSKNAAKARDSLREKLSEDEIAEATCLAKSGFAPPGWIAKLKCDF